MTYALSFFAAFVIGISKSGLKGIAIIIVTIMALLYGAKASTGIILPLLIFADIMAVTYYNRFTQWKYLKQLLPWMIAGVLIAVYVGKELPEDIFKKSMAIIILISVVIMFMWEKYESKRIPDRLWFIGSMGLAAGFTTMIGNLAGAFSNIFFLATRIPKNEFIGTAAWLFFIINLFKLPFHIFSWETINKESLLLDLTLIPAVLIGFFVGVKIVKKFKDNQFRKFILIMTAVGAMIMLIR
jgi:uncharacterized membrane protein YfcA